MFITFEGIDYSGKSTQAKLLVERLEQSGRSVLFLREPGGTAISEKIRLLLLDTAHGDLTQLTEVLLFSASRSQLVSQVISPELTKGTIVICDRYADSTSAYQGYGRGIPLASIEALNRIATSGLLPDLTILVDIPVEEVVVRQRKKGALSDRMESAGIEFYERVRKGYEALSAADPKRWYIVDGRKSVQEIHQQLWQFVQSRL